MKKVVPSNANLIPESADLVFQGKLFATLQWPQEMFDGSEQTFEMVKRPDTVQVICVIDDKIIVLDEEQPHHGKRVNFPCGRVDETDADTLTAAQREVLEETGKSFADWKLIAVTQPQSKIEWFIYTYIATRPTGQAATNHEVGEKIIEELWSFDQVKEASLQGVKHLDEISSLIKDMKSLNDLLALPEFQGKEVDR